MVQCSMEISEVLFLDRFFSAFIHKHKTGFDVTFYILAFYQ